MQTTSRTRAAAPRLAGWTACLCASVLLTATPPPAAAETGPTAEAQLTVTGIERFQFSAPDSDAEGLSGLTWIEGDRYYAASDSHAKLYPMTITLDPQTGGVTAAALGEPMQLRDERGQAIAGADLEAVAWDATAGTVLISDEVGPTLREHDLNTGRALRTITPGSHEALHVFSRLQLNRGWESVALAPDGEHVWIANEEALRGDGPGSSVEAGTLVRIQRLTRQLEPAGQWAYRTDPVPNRIAFPGRYARLALAGVSELLALDDGRLIALERHFGGTEAGLAHYRVRLYEVLLDAATDVTDRPGLAELDEDAFAVAGKRLLVEVTSYAPIDNFEGMTLGPELADGSRSLLLIADNNGGHVHSLYALRLRQE